MHRGPGKGIKHTLRGFERPANAIVVPIFGPGRRGEDSGVTAGMEQHRQVVANDGVPQRIRVGVPRRDTAGRHSLRYGHCADPVGGHSVNLGDSPAEVGRVDECHRPQTGADLRSLDTPVVVADQHGAAPLQQLFLCHVRIAHEPTDAVRGDLDEGVADDAGAAGEEQRLIDAVGVHHVDASPHVDRAGGDRPDRRAVGSPALLDELPAHRPIIFVDRGAVAFQPVRVVQVHEQVGDEFRRLTELFNPHVSRHEFVVVGVDYPTGHGVQRGHARGPFTLECSVNCLLSVSVTGARYRIGRPLGYLKGHSQRRGSSLILMSSCVNHSLPSALLYRLNNSWSWFLRYCSNSSLLRPKSRLHPGVSALPSGWLCSIE